jgi:filamentous hemagglutinin family protein
MKKDIQKIVQFLIAVLLMLIFAISAWADGSHPRGIKLDGTLGNVGKLDIPGPDYEIKPEYGHQTGGNLFHSFEQFNIHSGERATFSGPESVQNIISRVTGGTSSWIDGTLSSAIPGADVYLLNCSGIMFGPNSSLDLGGSFHVSTSDYLRFGENERFYTLPQEGDVLSAAAPAAFGFLGGNTGKITAQGFGELTQAVWGEETYRNWADWNRKNPDYFPGLAVPDGESISMIAGDIEISGTYYPYEGDASYNVPVGASLTAPEGSVNLAALRTGEAEIRDAGLNISGEETGNIALSGGARITASGSGEENAGAGSIFIRGGEFVMEGAAEILSEPTDADGQVIDIQSRNISLKDSSVISVKTYGKGNGTDIRLNASEALSIQDGGEIRNSSFYGGEGAGTGGTIFLSAERISVAGNESRIGGESHGTGKGGDISIAGSESVRISDKAWLSTSATKDSTGSAGKITIQTPSLTVESKSLVESESEGPGKSGTIAIHTENLLMTGGAKLSVRTEQTGFGGSLSVSGPDPDTPEDFANSVNLSGTETVIRADTVGSADAGTISISAQKLSLTENASLVSSSSGPGNAGDITLNVGSLDLSKGAAVASASEYPVANVYRVEMISDLDALTDEVQEGEIVIVEDAGDGISAPFIRTGTDPDPWIRVAEKITTVPDISPLNDLRFSMGVEPGAVFVVEDIGDGTSGVFVHHNLNIWIKISNIQAVSELEQRNRFVSLPGDVLQITNQEGSADYAVFTGEEWIFLKEIYTVSDIAERDALAVEKGDAVKVTDAGAAKSFIYDGQEWKTFYMTGNAGNIAVHAQGAVALRDDGFLSTENSGGIGTGQIRLDTDTLQLSDSALISATGKAMGDAGMISVHADKNAVLADDAAMTTATLAQGRGGDISLEAESLILADRARVSSESRAQSQGGNAGRISVHGSDSVSISGSAAITTDAVSAGGGSIEISPGNRLNLSGGEITTSVMEGAGNGGDIRIGDPEFVILNHSNIRANADAGDGGAIFIHTEHFIQSSDSAVTATSKRGNDGTVKIEAPDTDLSKDLRLLPESFVDAVQWIKTPCVQRRGENISSFVLKGRDGVLMTFDDWAPSPLE